MKVTIRLSTESSLQITIPDNSTVEDLRNSIKVSSNSSSLPKDFKLIYNGQRLQPYNATLSSFGITSELIEKSSSSNSPINIILMSQGSDTPPISPQISSSTSSTNISSIPTIPTTTIKKTKKKNKCSFKNCNSTPLRMVGTCSHCQGKFCAKHRLLEDHICIGLQNCKDNAHESNAMRLQQESTIASRV
ncbi:uncharacterized protein KGF55_004902 [Candida pseudojiufengensis]|uniref:uncharacterized protein n=1 Tax=Candida pseudojiufengensis TaxID=497109 RepID=UPI002225B200|nr:uncharacterized protein KGF55_004902 [Candida pseudojiufengensis]KAI5960179.1 hypothetical protein KGF55_004902 [Candida pseudojiufengensis]